MFGRRVETLSANSAIDFSTLFTENMALAEISSVRAVVFSEISCSYFSPDAIA
uniref:Uncharacterized protein n=1 Tax=Myoviridae sp. ctvns3 TaxID=2825204 RepID=A0A8S5PD74_9CAUD|nr:MAG TPA: hypothetical protein [Myoviridae sp. ctvns3]